MFENYKKISILHAVIKEMKKNETLDTFGFYNKLLIVFKKWKWPPSKGVDKH